MQFYIEYMFCLQLPQVDIVILQNGWQVSRAVEWGFEHRFIGLSGLCHVLAALTTVASSFLLLKMAVKISKADR